jgi:hypothetical protein
MNNLISATFADMELASPQSHNNLHLFPILDPDAPSVFEYDYQMFSEAHSQGLARITETANADSEPALCLINDSNQPVLFIDDGQMTGDMQHHALKGLSVLAPAGCETHIPVLCQSDTGARSDEHTAHDSETDEHTNAFAIAHNHVGVLIAIDSRIMGIELYDRPSTYAAQHPWLIKRYVKNAIASKYREKPPRPGDARQFMEILGRGHSNGLLDSAGLGKTLWLDTYRTMASALVVDRRIMHLTASTGSAPDKKLTMRRYREYQKARA